MARKRALIVTNSRYEDERLARFATPAVHGSEVAEVLRAEEIGGFDDVIEVVDGGMTEVRRTIARFYENVSRDDLLLFYYSGHGIKDEQGHLYLAVRDTEPALLAATAIEAGFVTERMDRSVSRRLLIFLDCSYSGAAIPSGSKSRQTLPVDTAGTFEGTGRGRIVITASDSLQYAWEGDRVIGEAGASAFTRYLVEGLKTGAADVDGDGLITVDELYDYIYEQVVSYTPGQTPGKWASGQQGDIVLARSPSSPFGAPRDPIRNDFAAARVRGAPQLVHELVEYANAKVVLVGDSGVGKSGLALVLAGQPFAATESTHGRRVFKFDSRELNITGGRKEIRDTLLWDLAGQPGYRLVHQLDLSDVAVAVVVFDAHSETDPMSGALHWVRALRQAQGLERSVTLPKLLVAARVDRGGVAVSQARVEEFRNASGFTAYFETSAKEGLNIATLREAIKQAIDWDTLPKVSSNALFERIRAFVGEEQKALRVLSSTDDLYRQFVNVADVSIASESLRVQFETCLGRLEALGVIQRLSFGNLVLLQPEMLAGFASALINAARDEPDGLGSIAEERARRGDFFIPDEGPLRDGEQKKLLLIATIEHLLRHEIAFREEADLVFPSQLTRENPDLPDPEGKAVVFAFEGPLLNIYATLAVRLMHTGLLTKKELWKNAATYRARVGGTAGFFLREIEEGRGELALFFDTRASEETRFYFEEYVSTHLARRAVPGTVQRRRIFVCDKCGTPVADLVAARRRERGSDWLACPVCDARVSLRDREERLTAELSAVVGEMDGMADSRRAVQTAVSVLEGKIATHDFDVFLCHNSQDKDAVKKIGEDLKRHGILPWLDEWELRPGFSWQSELEKQISKIKSAVVFVGNSGLGPWQRRELYAFLSEFHDRRCPVIPALLPDAPNAPDLPVFLRGMTWVDFRNGNPRATDQLIWGITGERRLAAI